VPLIWSSLIIRAPSGSLVADGLVSLSTCLSVINSLSFLFPLYDSQPSPAPGDDSKLFNELSSSSPRQPRRSGPLSSTCWLTNGRIPLRLSSPPSLLVPSPASSYPRWTSIRFAWRSRICVAYGEGIALPEIVMTLSPIPLPSPFIVISYDTGFKFHVSRRRGL
jgi:hypothetical protein